MELRPVDINDIIRGFQKMMTRLIGENIELAADCGQAALVVETDIGQLEQVLMNLATNARDAMPSGGKLTIRSRLLVVAEDQGDELKRGSYAVITVTDTGCGMDKKIQEHLFEPFFTTKEAGKGTGLGLATSYGIIKKHNGSIRAYSEPGKGTTFTIHLPLSPRALPESRHEENGLLPPGTETILLIEDHANVRIATRDMLREFGYSVLEAADGEDAIKVFLDNRDKVRLVLCDLIMPKKSGKETYEEIKKMKPDMKAIFTSGYAPDSIAETGLLEEGINFMSKPVSMIDLIRKIRQVLDS
jgi:CheY-like chemotaxis protein